MPSDRRDPWENVPNLSGVTSGDIESVREAGDPARFHATGRGGQDDAVSQRILNQPRCRVIKTTQSDIPHANTQYGITSKNAFLGGGAANTGGWNVVVYDNDGMFNAASDDSAIFINTAGIYMIGGSFDWDLGGRSDGRRLMDINQYDPRIGPVNSGFVVTSRVVCRAETPSNDNNICVTHCTAPTYMNAGQCIRMRLYQTNGVAGSLGASGASDIAWFEQTMFAHRISTFGSDNQ